MIIELKQILSCGNFHSLCQLQRSWGEREKLSCNKDVNSKNLITGECCLFVSLHTFATKYLQSIF